jgi:hypothetical protein
MPELVFHPDSVGWHIVIRPDSRLWSFRLSGGMRVSTFMRTLAPPEEPSGE